MDNIWFKENERLSLREAALVEGEKKLEKGKRKLKEERAKFALQQTEAKAYWDKVSYDIDVKYLTLKESSKDYFNLSLMDIMKRSWEQFEQGTKDKFEIMMGHWEVYIKSNEQEKKSMQLMHALELLGSELNMKYKEIYYFISTAEIKRDTSYQLIAKDLEGRIAAMNSLGEMIKTTPEIRLLENYYELFNEASDISQTLSLIPQLKGNEQSIENAKSLLSTVSQKAERNWKLLRGLLSVRQDKIDDKIWGI